MTYAIEQTVLHLLLLAALDSTSINYCPSEWVYLSHTNNCYKVQYGELTYAEAKDECNSIAANLTSITHSFQENEFIASLASTHIIYEGGITPEITALQTWIGLMQQDKHSWQWVDGTNYDYPNWSPALEVIGRSTEKWCVLLMTDIELLALRYKWVNVDCQRKLRAYVCKKPSLHIDDCNDSFETSLRYEK